MDLLREIAEKKIREAMEEGKFDNLALKGQPIPLEDYSRVSEELRVGFKILKNAGVLPPEMELRKEIVTLQDLINGCIEDHERKTLRERLERKVTRYNILMERRKRRG